jgi:hypothetical protein
MIKQKITALVMACVLTAGLMSPISTVPAHAQTKADASIIINFCKIAHRRFLQGDKGAYLSKGMDQLDASNRPVVALACAAYGEGFDVGTRSLV